MASFFGIILTLLQLDMGYFSLEKILLISKNLANAAVGLY